MADQKGISKLDEKLISGQIIAESFAGDLPLVHRKMNAILKKTGAVLSDEIFETGNAALRKWLNLLYKQGASQEKLTAYLRCGLAHLTYDFIESQYHQIDLDDLVSRALVSMKNRNLHASFFKAPVAPAKATAKKSKPAAKKIKAIKKSELEKKAPAKAKTTVKKAAGTAKKPAAKAKAPATKKAAPKKAPAKKPAAKAKAPAKKKASPKKAAAPTAKKAAVKAKKPATKKVATKKAATKKPAPKKATAKKDTAKKTTVKAKAPAKKKTAATKATGRGAFFGIF